MLLGLPFAALWRVCLDQRLVQRVTCAASVKHGQVGALASGWLVGAAAFTWVFAGTVGRLVAARNLGCTHSNDCNNAGFAFASM